jgi:hypothetical protein
MVAVMRVTSYQNSNLIENCNWREVPAVLLISPKPLPSTTFDGKLKLTKLNTLKNSARN